MLDSLDSIAGLVLEFFSLLVFSDFNLLPDDVDS